MPSAESSTCRAPSAITVIASPTTITTSLRSVGEVLYRESRVADNVIPGGAGPAKSVNTPTIWGRKS